MSWQLALTIYGIVLLACLSGGVGIGTSIGLVGILGITLVAGTDLWLSLGDIVWNTTNNFTLVSIPLFVLMGEIILRSGIAGRFYSGVAILLRWLPGGLAQTNIFGCAVFSAISGSSVATAMTVGSVAIPEMRKRGYDDKLTLGTLTGGGCLGILIPPSIPLIVYASMTQVSLLDLFMAGVIPGVTLAAIFMIYVGIRVAITPALAPRIDVKPTPKQLLRASLDSLPVIGLIAAIIGSMYFGIVTPTEAAALGCLFALILACAYRELTKGRLKQALVNAAITSGVVMFITVNAQILNFAVVTSGIGEGLASSLVDLGLSPFMFFLLLLFVYLVVGMFIDGLSIMLLTVPLLYSSFMTMGFDGVWTGIIIVVFIELGALTPPMGLNLFAVQSIASDASLGKVAMASMPFALMIVLFAFLMYFFPEIALWLPSAMKGA
ncbi:TRAP transporter large permease [Pollutimonas bauzanensis]|uniref:TRAP transporter large permease protein n=1 Tax=Pollutimonas bauzanensis TaxID=658167 RepID=A0A1M5Q4C4_9BURK|nr:TRAP transporter large permease [Pollutimonas bauzanensis]SHH08621.1 TRAP transporter, DctM subunit [Pollutimonas bauzanensis]